LNGIERYKHIIAELQYKHIFGAEGMSTIFDSRMPRLTNQNQVLQKTKAKRYNAAALALQSTVVQLKSN